MHLHMHESEFIVYYFVCVCASVYICDIWRERDVLGEWEYTVKYPAKVLTDNSYLKNIS